MTRSKPWHKAARRLAPLVGYDDPELLATADPRKAWDVLRTIDAVTRTTRPDEPVLDVGCMRSEVPLALARLGYRRLAGCDVDPRVTRLTRPPDADLRHADVTALPWDAATFAAVTSTSMIEHGVDTERALAEMARVLRPGGVLTLSTDYWPDPVDTHAQQPFDLPWRIFDREGLGELLEQAAAAGFEGDGDDAWRASRPKHAPIRWRGCAYTFVHVGLRRR